MTRLTHLHHVSRQRRGRQRQRQRQQRRQIIVLRICSVFLLLALAGWLMATVGAMLFHGFYRESTAHHTVPFFLHHHHENAAMLPPPPPPVLLPPYASPLLIFTAHRAEYLHDTLADVVRYIPRDCRMGCPVIVSQDGHDADVAAIIQDYRTQLAALHIPLVHWQHPRSALRGSGGGGGDVNAYQALARHYGWALQQVFADQAMDASHSVSPQRVLILEEDLHIAVDFFGYFAATAPLLDADASLLAVSAFNDNGQFGQDATRILRSDFFPGLGWMMTRQLWQDELARKWPTGYWDDWLRDPAQRQGRHVLRPEVSRTFHFGAQGGASNNLFGELLRKVRLNTENIDWNGQDLTYLQPHRYDAAYWQLVSNTQLAGSVNEALDIVQTSNARLEYHDFAHFQHVARQLEIMDDEKAGIARTSYHGVVEMRAAATAAAASSGDHILFVTPPLSELQQALQQ